MVDYMKLLWSIAVFVVLLGTILLAGMCVKYARSETIKVQWTNPSFNSDSLNCMLADSTRPLTDLAGIKVWFSHAGPCQNSNSLPT